jgi:hypothetical protein
MHRLFVLVAATLAGILLCCSLVIGQDSLNVRRLAQLYEPSMYRYAYDVAITAERAYLCSWSVGLSLADISEPGTLVDLGHFYPPC